LLLLITLISLLGAPSSQAKSGRTTQAAGHRHAYPNPDILLQDIYSDIVSGQLRAALNKTDKLIATYPHFHLAHLIRGDLLRMHAHPIAHFGDVTHEAYAARLQDLRAEAMARLKAIAIKPEPALTPRAFTQLRESHQYAVLVDTAHSRLYVYRNRQGKLVLLDDYYISQGKLGVHKLREGDQKTPIGIYRITRRIKGAKLPDFYGTGALPLNYPNDWDKVHGRGGSGIWLHGVPSESYSRPPLASDGCVALTNPDMTELAKTLDIYKTLVVISDRVEMVNEAVLKKDREFASNLIEKWRRDMEYGNRDFLLNHYSKQFRSHTNESLPTWFGKQYAHYGNARTNYKLHNLSLMRYPGNPDLIAAAFSLDVRRGSITSQARRFQLWAKEGDQWKIVFENTIKDYL
jgi:murein L,D-transpeptidase YafK